MSVYIIGINSFIGKNVYLKLRLLKYNIFCLSHDEIKTKLSNVTSDDIIINFCGVNRSNNNEEYVRGNYIFVKDLIACILDKKPYFIHTSSYAVNGFTNILPVYMRMFISTKLEGEHYLLNNYPLDKLCIIRPSNIFGYNCEPYYNNILVSLIYEYITNIYTINRVNMKCIRNFLSIDGLVDTILDILKTKKTGVYNIVSSNNVGLDELLPIIYDNKINQNISVIEDEHSVVLDSDNNNSISTIIVVEDLDELVKETINKMRILLDVKRLTPYKVINRLVQGRGDMVEISNLSSKRLYTITITQNSFRGNHFHDEQIEEFYINRGQCIFLLAHKDFPEIVHICNLKKYGLIQVNPYIIHTLVNDFVDDDTEVFVTSTQEYIPNVAVDTTYINILQ